MKSTLSINIFILILFTQNSCNNILSIKDEYKNFDKSTLNGLYVNCSGNENRRIRLSISTNGMVNGWIKYHGEKKLLKGIMVDTKNLEFHFDLYEEDVKSSIKTRYLFTIRACNLAYESNNYLLEGYRYIDKNGRQTKKNILLQKIWVSSAEDLDEVWEDEQGEFLFHEDSYKPQNRKGSFFYFPYDSCEIETVPPRELVGGNYNINGDVYSIKWNKTKGFSDSTTTLIKYLFRTSDTSYYILKGQSRIFYLTERGHVIDTI